MRSNIDSADSLCFVLFPLCSAKSGSHQENYILCAQRVRGVRVVSRSWKTVSGKILEILGGMLWNLSPENLHFSGEVWEFAPTCVLQKPCLCLGFLGNFEKGGDFGGWGTLEMGNWLKPSETKVFPDPCSSRARLPR